MGDLFLLSWGQMRRSRDRRCVAYRRAAVNLTPLIGAAADAPRANVTDFIGRGPAHISHIKRRGEVKQFVSSKRRTLRRRGAVRPQPQASPKYVAPSPAKSRSI
jgi:hypothetical protein